MKTQYVFLFLAFVSFQLAKAQSVIPNNDFEQWESGSYSFPTLYQSSSCEENSELFISNGEPFNLNKVAGYHGSYAAKLTTVKVDQDTVFGYFINYEPNNDNFNAWHGGIPYDQQPTGIRGYYKYNLSPTEDGGVIILAFSKNGVNIGTYMQRLDGPVTDFTLFNYTLNPPLSQAPDSVIFAVTSSDLSSKPIPGATIEIDSISFTGVLTQPLLFDGDLEMWTDTTINRPISWYSERKGTAKTSDAYSGDFAVELTTYLGDQNQQPAARQARVATGYYPNNCDGNCKQIGGFPFTNSKDALIFYYKYFPELDDMASVTLSFKKNNIQIGQQGIQLSASSNYQMQKINFDLGVEPDSVIIDINSSDWNNSALGYVGSKLIIDDLMFESDIPTNINAPSEHPSTTSNVANGVITVSGLENAAKVEVYAISGQKVFMKVIETEQIIEINGLPKGLYAVKVTNCAYESIVQKVVIH